MIHSVSNTAQTQPVDLSAPGTQTKKPAQPQSQSAAASDSVHLSQAAQAQVAVLKEVRETSYQTSQEAGHGDLQAKRLLAKEAAAESAKE
jgi:hypothetical protein